MVDARTKRLLSRYKSETLSASDVVLTPDVLDHYMSILIDPRQGTGVKSPDPEFPPHGGVKTPLPFQLDVIQQCTSSLQSTSRVLVSMPTGAGKTFTCIRLLMRLIDEGARRIVWLSPQSLLLEQALAELRTSWYAEPRRVALHLVGSESAFRKDYGAGAVLRFATLQKVGRETLSDLDIDVVIVDEAHHLEANAFGQSVSSLITKNTKLIGLSATPGRGNEGELHELVELFHGCMVFPQLLGDDPVSKLREFGVYSILKHQVLRERAVSDFDRIVAKGQSALGKSENAAFSSSRLNALVTSIAEFPQDRSIVFCHSIAHACVVWAALCHSGVPASIAGSTFSRAHNEAAIEDFRNGHTRSMVNVKIAAVGADFPSANAAYFSVPTGSPIFFEQAVGRVARGPAVGGTVESFVLDFDNHFRRFGQVRSYARYLHAWGQASS